jgi:phage FluMu protein Com
MPKCPKCGKVINYLINVVSGWKNYIFDGRNYEEGEFEPDGVLNFWVCPECKEELLFDSEEEAIKFLKEVKGGENNGIKN